MAQATFSELIGREKPTLVDFSAEWCGPCKMMAPILEKLKSDVGDTASIIKIDIDRNPILASSYQVQSVPTLVLFKNGKLLWRQAGVVPTTYLKEIIEKYNGS